MPNLLGRAILVVEDEAVVSLDIAQVLQAAGCLVIGPAASVAAALRHVPLHKLDGAVVDMRLGRDLAGPVLDALAAAGVPAVIVTGYPMQENYARHGEGFVRKPFDVSVLLEALGRAIDPASVPTIDERLAALMEAAQTAGDRHVALAIGAALWKNRTPQELLAVIAAEAASATADRALAHYRTTQ